MNDDKVPIPAITLWPEWLPCITKMGKDIENRTWAPPDRLIGSRIALHAGKSIGGGSRKRGLDSMIAMALEAGWHIRDRPLRGHVELMYRYAPMSDWKTAQIHLGAVVATAVIESVTRESESRWAMPDCYHWVLADVRELPEPVPARGRQQLWTVELTADQIGDALNEEPPLGLFS